VVLCNIETIQPVDCSNPERCPLDKPVFTCTGDIAPKVYCGISTTLGAANGPTCQWYHYCTEPVDPVAPVPSGTCGEADCGTKPTGFDLSACADGKSQLYACSRLTLSATNTGTVTECRWTNYCPTSTVPVDLPTCEARGTCGNLCVPTEVAPSLAAINYDICKTDIETSCEQKCLLNFRITGSCQYVTGRGCSYTYNPGYDDCLRQCSGGAVVTPTYTCSGSLCDCDYEHCFDCVQSFFGLDSQTTRSYGTCIDKKFGDACKLAFNGQTVTSKPSLCAVVDTTGSEIPADLVDILKAIRDNLKEGSLQTRLDTLIAAVNEAKDFLVSVKFAFSPEVANTEVKVEVLIDISGQRDPTIAELKAICETIKRAANELTGKNFLRCNIERVSATPSKKRGIQQNGGSFVNTLYAGNEAATGAGAVTVLSFVIAVLSLLATMF